MINCLAIRQLYPHRSMIAGFFPTPYVAVNAGAGKAAAQLRAEQEVINAQAGIPAVCITEIIPKCIDLFIRIKLAYGIRPSLIVELFKSSTNFRPEQGVIYPAFGFIYIKFCWHHI